MWGRSFSSASYEEEEHAPKESKTSTVLRWLAVSFELMGGGLVTIIAVYLRFANIHPGATELNWKLLCDDKSLFAKQSTGENSLLLYLLVFTIPVFYIIIGEMEQIIVLKTASNITRSSKIFGMFVLGLMLTSFTADYLKILITQPRPYFLTVYGGNCPFPYNGTAVASEEFFEALKSFPSHLATVAGFCSLYAVVYSHKLHKHRAPIVLPIASQAFIILAVTVSLQHYISHKNHLWDIVMGLAMGSTTGLYMCCLVMNQMKGRLELKGEPDLPHVFIPRLPLPSTLATQALNFQNQIPNV